VAWLHLSQRDHLREDRAGLVQKESPAQMLDRRISRVVRKIRAKNRKGDLEASAARRTGVAADGMPRYRTSSITRASSGKGDLRT